jgi:hypothetical protein
MDRSLEPRGRDVMRIVSRSPHVVFSHQTPVEAR